VNQDRNLAKQGGSVKGWRRKLWFWRAAAVFVFALFGASAAHAQSEQKSKVVIVVTEDDAPCYSGKVTIRPRGHVEGWPGDKAQIVLFTGDKGRTAISLGAGSYRVTAVDSARSKLPALAYFKIKAGQDKPMKIRLNLLEWDCAHVTCKL
jgi:hypothetical protein